MIDVEPKQVHFAERADMVGARMRAGVRREYQALVNPYRQAVGQISTPRSNYGALNDTRFG